MVELSVRTADLLGRNDCYDRQNEGINSAAKTYAVQVVVNALMCKPKATLQRE